MIIAAINWQIGYILPLYALVLGGYFIVTIILRGSVSNAAAIDNNNSPTFASSIAFVVTAVASYLLAFTMGYYLWRASLLPAILRWRWMFLSHSGEHLPFPLSIYLCSFPYSELLRMALFCILVLPLWIPLLMSIALCSLCYLIGVRWPPALRLLGSAFTKLEFRGWKFRINLASRNMDNYAIIRIQYDEALATNMLSNQCCLPRIDAVSSEVQSDASADQSNCYPVRCRPCCHTADMANGCCSCSSTCCQPPQYTAIYTGYVDDFWRPVGTGGQWRDLQPGGEVLIGEWRNGIPVGPFRSREQSQGGGLFAAVKIGYFECSVGPMARVHSTISWRTLGECLFGLARYSNHCRMEPNITVNVMVVF